MDWYKHNEVDIEQQLAALDARLAEWGNTASEKQYLHRRKRALRLERARSIATHTLEEWCELLRLVDGFCFSCGYYYEALSKDHIVPLCHGGSDGIYNLQPICLRCNVSKRVEPIDFIYHLRPPAFRRPRHRPPVFYYREPLVPPGRGRH